MIIKIVIIAILSPLLKQLHNAEKASIESLLGQPFFFHVQFSPSSVPILVESE
jgi:hypothetical protein